MDKKRKIVKGLIIIGVVILLAPAFGMAQQALITVKVKCEKEQSVQSALDNLTGPATIVVTGICQENIVIKRDDVTIQGGIFVPADLTQNTILVQGARRVLITGVDITGGRNGITVYQGGSLTLDGDSTITGAKDSALKPLTQNGAVSAFGSSLIVNSSKIRENVRGVTVTDNSALVLTNSEVTNNTGTGVFVNHSSNALIGQSILGVAGRNTITGNGSSGVGVLRGSNALIDSNTIADNVGDGINVEGSSATITNNSVVLGDQTRKGISGNRKGISVHNGGMARIGITEGDTAGPNTVENNSLEGIQIANGAAAYIYGNTIQNNGSGAGRPGVAIYRATGRLLGRNNIKNNGGHGVEVDQGSLLTGVGDFTNLPQNPPSTNWDLISQNGDSGISGWNNAKLDVQSVNVTNNTASGIVLSLQSTLRIYGSTVTGNVDGILLYDGSSVARYADDSPQDNITGNSGFGILCNTGSNLIGVSSGVSGNGGGQVVNCPGF